MLGLKYFIRVQTFWRRPFVASRNFCHPGIVLGRAILQARSTCDQMWLDGPQVQDMGHCQLIKDVMTKMLESYVFSYKDMLKNKKSKCNDFFEWNYNSCDLWGIIPGEVTLLCSSVHWRIRWKEAIAVSINLIVYSCHGTSWITKCIFQSCPWIMA